MSEKPILFSGAMVRAILDGAKTQTRRLVKLDGFGESSDPGLDFVFYRGDRDINVSAATLVQSCAPVFVGDTLWVKETWRSIRALDHCSPTEMGRRALEAGYSKPWAPLLYDADGAVNGEWGAAGGDPGKTRVSIHMPRWASRLSLRVTDVRVERLGDISAEDCVAEGAVHAFAEAARIAGYTTAKEPTWHPLRCFPWLWCQVHGPDAWERDAAKWVWVYSFERA
jgi:hypothetical protein